MKINGLPVVDATKAIKLTINDADCKLGQTKDSGACAAARALLRQVPNCTQARVYRAVTYILIGKKWLRCMTPRSLRTEIVAFDRGGKFEPGEFELNAITSSKRLGEAHSARPPQHDRPGKASRAQHRTLNVRAHGANR